MTLTPGANQPAHDLVFTPFPLAQQIVEHFQPYGTMLDPAAGPEKPFYRAMYDLALVDPVDWCEITLGRDFFQWDISVNWIITNPPWSKLRNFLIHSMQYANEIVFLATLTHFVTRARLRDIKSAGFALREAYLVDQPPAPWPSSGFQLAAVWISRGWAGPLMLTDGTHELTPVGEISLEDLGL